MMPNHLQSWIEWHLFPLQWPEQWLQVPLFVELELGKSKKKSEIVIVCQESGRSMMVWI